MAGRAAPTWDAQRHPPAAEGLSDRAVDSGAPSTLDSAREEMRVGRYWHAVRLLRSLGLDSGDREGSLLLAHAEAGWGNWASVLEVLEDAAWLEDADAALLLGLAQEHAGRWPEAADAYGSSVERMPGTSPALAPTLARLARARARAGRADAALAALDRIPPQRGFMRSWAALELAGPAAEDGDTTQVLALLERVEDAEAAAEGWRLLPRARLAANDSAGAERDFRAVAATASGARQAEAMVEVGRLAVARGDTAAARKLFVAALDDAPLRSAATAAAALVRTGGGDLELTLRLAGILDRAGDGGPALSAYDRAWALSERAGTSLPDGVRLARARLMATVRSRRDEAVEEFRAIRASAPDERIGARNLEIWAALRSRQGLTSHVKTLRRWLLEEYPGSPQAAEVLWSRASTAQSAGDLGAALRDYALLIERAPAHNRAGEARMRLGQIELGRGRLEAAAAVYEKYLEDFPAGRRWEEASYWAARIRRDLGDSAAARTHLERIRREEPVSYYAVMGAHLVGEPYGMEVSAGPDPVEPVWLKEGLARLDLLAEAGLERGADTEEERLVRRAGDSVVVKLRLAEALNERGRTIGGINLGWEIRSTGRPWDRRLLRVVFPFPYRELVMREAAEWGVDPFVLAALIRQESAFKADIRSRAGAMGLMQVMPPTGRELARAHGPEGFAASVLSIPEVNLHLGAAFFVEMSRRYGGDLPLVLSAYNAGPTRATRWRRYPEVAEPDRFTERIPFEETRGYVKNVRRNLGVYQVLYGED